MVANAANARAAGYYTALVAIIGFIVVGSTMFFVKRARRRHAQGKRWYL